MKLFGALIVCASALTNDEIAAFKCRSGSYAQYDRVSSNGGTEMNRRASSKFSSHVTSPVSISLVLM